MRARARKVNIGLILQLILAGASQSHSYIKIAKNSDIYNHFIPLKA